jgi:hypothetical protein
MNLPKPFDQGVWLICSIGGKDVVAQIDDLNTTEEDIRKELVENRCVLATFRRKFIISTVQFPMQARGPNGQPAGFSTANIVTVMKYERSFECFNEFPTHCVLSQVAFISDMDPDDIKILAETVSNGEKAADIERRANKSNITLAKG